MKTLAEMLPAAAAEWHPTKNGALQPTDVSYGAGARAWWKCAAGPDHEWESPISWRAAGRGCPFCAGRRVSVTNTLAVRAPAVAAQWHPTRNGALTAGDVTFGTQTAVWWLCPAAPDHEWEAAIGARTSGHGCPFCRGLRVCISNCLATLRPDLAAEWHPVANGPITPSDVVCGSNIPIWWLCRVNPEHVWAAKVAWRMTRGCPFCAHHRVSPENSLAARFPDIASQWHPTRNGTLRPEDVNAGSNQMIWWKCVKGLDHEWQTRCAARTAKGTTCPFCDGIRVSVTNSLANVRPEIASQWHPSRNGELTASGVASGATQKVWWKCPEGPDHEWQATISSRTSKGRACPFCAGRNVSVTNALARFPRLAAEWHPAKNGAATPSTLTSGSGLKAWWLCQFGHEWRSPVHLRVARMNHCPICNRLKRTTPVATTRRVQRKVLLPSDFS